MSELEHHGVKGMHWGVHKKEWTRNDLTDDISSREYRKRRLQIEAREDKQSQVERKKLEADTGVKYRKDTYNISRKASVGAIKKHYADDEIKIARQNQKLAADAVSALNTKYGKDGKYWMFTKEHEKALDTYLNNRDRLVAAHKTRGEKAAAAILLGPAGSYLASDRRSIRRMANAKTQIKWKTAK